MSATVVQKTTIKVWSSAPIFRSSVVLLRLSSSFGGIVQVRSSAFLRLTQRVHAFDQNARWMQDELQDQGRSIRTGIHTVLLVLTCNLANTYGIDKD